eukprot:4766741-Alexandrium_andersonii.AAC.1
MYGKAHMLYLQAAANVQGIVSSESDLSNFSKRIEDADLGQGDQSDALYAVTKTEAAKQFHAAF